MISIKSLSRLQFRQFLRSKSKSGLYGSVFSIVYFWIIELVLFFALKADGTPIPALAVWMIGFFFCVPDFIFKLTTVHDNSVMDAFLKTRPIPQEKWDSFLSVSQFWKDSNLIMPLALAPMCFLFIPFLSGLILFLTLYLLSVFGGFLLLLIKHRGTYQPERQVKNYMASGVESAKGNFIFGIQFRSFIRSKRLRSSVLYLSILFYLQLIPQAFDPESKAGGFYVFLFIFLFACSVPQYGFAVEANFFNGIWSRPISIEKLLESKYKFGVLCGVTAAVLCLPLCIWGNIAILDIIAFTLFNCFFNNLLMMFDAYNCVPFDLFGKVFFNTQGSQSTFKGSSFIIISVCMAIGISVIFIWPGWKCQAVLSALGIIGLCSYKPFFRAVVKKFMENRYRYMEKYMSK